MNLTVLVTHGSELLWELNPINTAHNTKRQAFTAGSMVVL